MPILERRVAGGKDEGWGMRDEGEDPVGADRGVCPPPLFFVHPSDSRLTLRRNTEAQHTE
jgi:hypothetical protein